METHEFDITIAPDGAVVVHVKGTHGPACEEYVGFFEKILSAEAETERTSEYYLPPSDVVINLEQTT